jgi:hypothetical protein
VLRCRPGLPPVASAAGRRRGGVPAQLAGGRAVLTR